MGFSIGAPGGEEVRLLSGGALFKVEVQIRDYANRNQVRHSLQ
jgi:hypothetical protein